MTNVPIPAEAERPCPQEGCPFTLKVVPDEISIDGQLATVRLVCGNQHQGKFRWLVGERR